MAENFKPWYPKVDDESKSLNYIFLDTLKDDIWHSGVYTKAENKFNLVESSLRAALYPQLDDLLQLAIREERKEIQLLEDFVNKGNLTPSDAGDKIRGFNKLYQKKSILLRNLNKIINVAEGLTEDGRIDITANFYTYIEQAISAYFSKTPIRAINEKALLNITKEALILAMKSKDSNRSDETQTSYIELVKEIEVMESEDDFIREVFQLYFGTSWETMKASLDKQKKKSEQMSAKQLKGKITKSQTVHGNLFEHLQGLILKTLGNSVSHTGGSKQKSDITLLYNMEVELPTQNGLEKDESVRKHFINKYQEMYNSLEQATGTIVQINAKNYDITSSNFRQGGFSAQSITSIKNLEYMLQAYNYDAERTERLIFALTNIGPDTISKDVGDVSHNLAMLIAYFLFDDIDMDITGNVNAVHLLNLDGIYIPFSCFLYAAYDTLKDFENISQDMVHVSYKPKSVNYVPSSPNDPLTKEKWENYVGIKQNQDNIKVSFFKKFPQYVKQHLGSFDFS